MIVIYNVIKMGIGDWGLNNFSIKIFICNKIFNPEFIKQVLSIFSNTILDFEIISIFSKV